MEGASRTEQVFQPGELVPESGVYTVVHDQHRERHSATIFYGDRFPQCARCGQLVRFILLRSADLISEDVDFKHGAAGKGRGAP